MIDKLENFSRPEPKDIFELFHTYLRQEDKDVMNITINYSW